METTEKSTTNFSELIEHNSKLLASISPSGLAVASAAMSQLQVWNIDTKNISHRFECDNDIDFIKWSPDSDLICCGMLKECIQIWNLNMPHWRCKICGYLAFVNIYWAPDSYHLLVISEFYIKISIFSLVSSVVAEIDYPKAVENGIAFSPCEKYLVVAQRRNLVDYLKIYSCDTWEAIKAFPIETRDLASISFSPKDLVVAVLESAECKVLFYSIDGRLLGKYVSDLQFGLTSLSWSTVKNFIAVGDSFGEVKILNRFDFEVISSYQHPDLVDSSDIVVYKVIACSEVKNSPGVPRYFELDEVIKSRPVNLLPSTLDNENRKTKTSCKSGVQTLEFSFDGKYIASINGTVPKIVFVYDVENFKICSVIIRGSNIKCISWHPEKPYLAICSTANGVDLWTPEGVVYHISPFLDDFPVCHVAWCSTGNSLILNSRDHFSMLFFS